MLCCWPTYTICCPTTLWTCSSGSTLADGVGGNGCTNPWHAYVLSRRWSPAKLWTDVEEYALRQETMARLVLGLITPLPP